VQKSYILVWYWLNRIGVIRWYIATPKEVMMQVTLTVMLLDSVKNPVNFKKHFDLRKEIKFEIIWYNDLSN